MLSSVSKVLKEKYDFVKRVWGADGEEREFEGETLLTIGSLHGFAEQDMEQIRLEQMMKQNLINESFMRDEGRLKFAESVLSFEELREEMTEDDEDVEKAAQRYHSKTREQVEDRESRRAERSIVEMINFKIEQAMNDIGLTTFEMGSQYYEFTDMLLAKDSEGAIKLLTEAGGKPKGKVKKAVTRLIRLHNYWKDEIDFDKGRWTEKELADLSNMSEKIVARLQWKDLRESRH